MPAPTTAADFVDLIRKSEVVDNHRLDAYLANAHVAGRLRAGPIDLSALLIRDGILTTFQVEQLLEGKWRRFSIGSYKVLERLGAGTQGSVYLCRHERIRKLVAVKVLPASSANDPALLERFYREARALAALNHPNIVRAYDINQEGSLHFIAMEYVDGSSLEHVTKAGGPISVIRAAQYMRQAAQGLQYSHETAGIMHRGINPSDILVDRGGVVRIIDFGMARFCGGEEPVSVVKCDSAIFQSPDYMAPEQISDPDRVDIRADIYSIGATFYFCLTRYTPFQGGSVVQKLRWLQTRQPEPIRRLRPRLPEGLATLIERMMAKDPAQRPQAPQDVVDALAPYTKEPIAPPPDDEMPRLCLAASAE
jgi:serine/threonine protein kinase